MDNVTRFVNEEGAAAVISQMTNVVARNVVAFAITRAQMRCLREAGESEQQWKERLPDHPFDLEFLATVLSDVLSQPGILRELIGGTDIRRAAGWDATDA
jgi:hypothetical protein